MLDSLIRNIKKIFTDDKKDLESDLLNSRLEIRVNDKEKELYKLYAKMKGTDLSKLMRKLMNEEINNFIKS